jgi:hypothetical protein
MVGKDMESPCFLLGAEIERALDLAIDGLGKMDAEILIQLACLCPQWEGKGQQLSIPNGIHARLSWKLLLLERLLRQTRINLNVLGLAPRQYSLTKCYRAFGRR